MVTQKGDNTFVVGIHGNFDQAQTGVKKMFSDAALAKEMDAAGYQFSSANSINIGRLVPQIVYYVYAYAKLYANGVIAKDEPVNVVVPTGNFGNILAAFYAKNMGIPIAKLICASNENKVLYDFFSTGTYDKNREFMLTSSPSMDILISSNLERLLFHFSGENDAEVRDYMDALARTGRYEVSGDIKAKLADEFWGGFCTEEATEAAIGRYQKEYGYLIDTHTAVAAEVMAQYRAATGDDTPTVFVSTASPYKFCGAVLTAIGETPRGDGVELLDQLHEASGVPVPRRLAALKGKARRFDKTVEKQAMEQSVLEFLQ